MAIASKSIPTNPGQSYDGVLFERMRSDKRYIVIAYQAKNCFGLIASEHNGIAILDDQRRQVVCDGIAREGFGFSGLTKRQWREAARLTAMSARAFRKFVNGHANTRYPI